MRLFLAQTAVLYDYPGLQERFASCIGGRWRTPASLHATVLFLGNRFSAEHVITTVSACDYVLDNAKLQGIGRFAHNRILYAAADYPTLVQTHRHLSEAFAIRHDRRYTPHVTLMRYKRCDPVCVTKVCTEYDSIVLGKLEGGLKLMRSTLTPTGAVYDTLYQF